MTTFEVIEAEDAFGDGLEDIGRQAQELADLFEGAARAAPGDEIADIDGMKVRHSRHKSMVRLGDKELPERITLYREDGTPRLVATAMVPRLLTKRHAETGERCFFVKPPVEPPKAIPETCPYCKRSKQGNPRPFYDIDDLDGHIETLHPSELARRMRREDLASRAPSTATLLGTIALMSEAERKALREALAGKIPKEAS